MQPRSLVYDQSEGFTDADWLMLSSSQGFRSKLSGGVSHLIISLFNIRCEDGQSTATVFFLHDWLSNIEFVLHRRSISD